MSLENFKNRKIEWDTVNKNFDQSVQIVSGDVNSRTVTIVITDKGEPIDLTGYSVKLVYKYVYNDSSGFVMLTPTDAPNGEFSLIIPTEMTSPGSIKSNLILLNENLEQVIVSKNLKFISDDSTVTDLAQEVNNKIDDFTKLLLENMPQVMRSELNDLHAQTESNTSNIDLKANSSDMTSLQSAMNSLQSKVEAFGITPENLVTIKSLLDAIANNATDSEVAELINSVNVLTSNISLMSNGDYSPKANKTDLESLQSAVNNQSATISAKANQIDLDNLQTDVQTKVNAIYTNALSDHAEILTARGGQSSLDARLDGLDAKDTNLQMNKADKAFVDAQFASIVSGSPKGTFATLAALQTAYPSGTEGVFLVLENGHWYYYASGWKDGGVYQSAGVSVNSITLDKINTVDEFGALPFKAGRLNPDNGTDWDSDTTRAKTTKKISLVANRTITIKNPDYQFNVFNYDKTTEAYINNLNLWLSTYTTTSDYKVLLQIKRVDGTTFDSSTLNFYDLFDIDNKPVFLTDSGQLQDGIVTLDKLDADLITQLQSATNPKNVDLMLFMGQSNMAGRGTASEAPVVSQDAGMEFRAISDVTKLNPIIEPFGVNENNANGINEPGMKTGSLVSSFVNTYHNQTHRKVIAVSASRGGSTISQWQAGTPFLNDAIARLNNAKVYLSNNGYTIGNIFMIWCQGESDGDVKTPAETYKTSLDSMIKTMESEGVNHTFIIRIGNYRDDNRYQYLINAQNEYAKITDRVTMVATKFDTYASKGLMKDQFHYKQQAYNEVGEQAGLNAGFYVNNLKEPTIFDFTNNNLYYSIKN